MKQLFFFTTLILSSLILQADEGLWLPIFLNNYIITKMNKAGLQLSANDIYNTNNNSLKNTVIRFGKGCTAALISKQGLIITNYHCSYYYIKKHSTTQNNYLQNGFWAKSKKEELPNPGLTATFIIYIKDVTKKVLATVKKQMSIKNRNRKIDSICKIIEKNAIKKSNNKYSAEVKPIFYGNKYILIVSQTFKDIRLVGAPPESIGNFGGETDNWEWPRYTGDFALFRIYANKKNQPADYSQKNIPYKSKKYLKINIKGIKQNQFTMLMGFPGFTQEYIPSSLVKNIIKLENPIRIKLRLAKLNIINKAIKTNPKIKNQYEEKQKSIANELKKWQAEDKTLERLKILKIKHLYEQKFNLWAQKEKNKQYKNLLKQYKYYATKLKPYLKAYNYFIETIYLSDLWTIFYRTSQSLYKIASLNNYNQKKIEKQKLIKSLKTFLKKYNKQTDKEITKKMMEYYFSENKKEFFPVFYEYIQTSFNKNINKYIDYLYKNSIFTNKQKLIYFITNFYNKKQKYTIKNLITDPLYIFMTNFIQIYNKKIIPKYIKIESKIDSLNYLYMQAQMKMQKNKFFYPDANLSLRISYGKIKKLKTIDGIIYDYYTTLDGLIKKENPKIYDYKVPKKLKKLFYTKNFGKYADKNDKKIHICFIGNNHTSGGNSGSPVLNNKGQLIGLNFDRTWQSTMSDIKYDSTYCRNIMLDVRYILFIIDKYANAKNIINEMTIIE